MHRIFVNQENIFQPFIIKDKKEIHHALDVLRLKQNERITAFNGVGGEVMGIIQKADKAGIVVTPLEIIEKSQAKALSITLACAIPKRAKFDYIVEKATELGVDTIIPLITGRSEVHLNKERLALKLKHWTNIGISSAKQSQRATIPQISDVKTFKAVISCADNYNQVLIPCLTGKRKLLKEVLKINHSGKILVLIGPEGDFTQEEVSLAVKHKAVAVSLGELVLRIDTAAIYVISAINALLA